LSSPTSPPHHDLHPFPTRRSSDLSGSTRNLPGLPAYLPKAGYVKNTAKYVIGPIGLEKVDAPFPAQLVDFNAGAEVVLGTYQTRSEEHTSELQSRFDLVCRLLLEK